MSTKLNLSWTFNVTVDRNNDKTTTTVRADDEDTPIAAAGLLESAAASGNLRPWIDHEIEQEEADQRAAPEAVAYEKATG